MNKKQTTVPFKYEGAPNAARILIDTRGVLYCALYWALKQYDEPGDIWNATIFCFWQKLQCASRAFRTNRFIFCWDSETSLRKELYPGYKGMRQSQHTEADPYMPLFEEMRNEVIPSLGFKNSICMDGFEADDIIAVISKQESRLPMVIFSDDADMYQLITKNVVQMSIRRAISAVKPDIITRSRFKDIFGLEPEQWVEVKALAGCKSDSVPGIKGVGDTGAIAYLKGTLKKCLKYYMIEQGTEARDFSRRLVKLPFEGMPSHIDLHTDDLNFPAFIKMIQKYDMTSMRESEFWPRFFKGDMY